MRPTSPSRRLWTLAVCLAACFLAATTVPAQQWVTELRDPKQTQDADFARSYTEWTGEARFGSPLVDHLPRVAGIPMPKDVLGYHIGAPRTLTYYADILKFYRALEKASPRVKVETIGRSDEDRELVVVWISSEANIRNLQKNRDNLARIADPRGLSDAAVRQLIATTKPHYHLMAGLHSSETGPSEMLMELAYRLTAETSPFINQIRENVYVSITPVADADGRDRNVDNFYCNRDVPPLPAAPGAGRAGGAAAPAAETSEPAAETPPVEPPTPPAPASSPVPSGPPVLGVTYGCSLPYWGKYIYHDNNRDINLSQVSMRALADWYFTAHPPIMHDLHESLSLMYTYSGGAPQNPNLDPLLFAELPFFSNWEMAQMTKWGMPGVYTHAFMDGWSPGYLGSLAYNHNGLMKMYETQSGRDGGPGAAAAGRGRGEAVAGAEPTAGRAGRGAGGEGGAPGGGRAAQAAPARGAAPTATPAPAAAGRATIPTGRGGGQDREWYRGIPVPQGAAARFTRRNNTNYMQTGVLSSLQLTSMFPNLIIENFYVKTRNSIEQGRTTAPLGYVIPAQRDMTKPAELVRILRVQGIEVGQTTSAFTIGETTYGAGSYVIKGGQPYWRLAKNLLEKQDFPDPALRTYDDSGWTMGHAFNVDVKEIRDRAVLDVVAPLVKTPIVAGRVTGSGTAGLVVGHFGSNNMIAFRYKLRNVPMRVAEKSFTVDDVEFPAGSFIIAGPVTAEWRSAVTEYGLTAATFDEVPAVSAHDADVPRVALYSNWSGTQELGWYRHAFDQFGVPFDLIYKERVQRGNLRADYDVVIMASQNLGRTPVLAPPAARPSAYIKNDKYRFMGMYGESPDTSGGLGQSGVDAIGAFLEAGGTLITTDIAVRFPIEFGFARSVDTEGVTGVVAQKPLVQAEIARTESPIVYGFANRVFPVKYAASQTFLRVGPADQDNVVARFVGGDAAVLSGLMTGGEAIRGRAFVVDLPEAYRGKGRVVMFANNPIYRWQNHGEFNLVFNTIINWNDR